MNGLMDAFRACLQIASERRICALELTLTRRACCLPHSRSADTCTRSVCTRPTRHSRTSAQMPSRAASLRRVVCAHRHPQVSMGYARRHACRALNLATYVSVWASDEHAYAPCVVTTTDLLSNAVGHFTFRLFRCMAVLISMSVSWQGLLHT
jgi:hypothetical protein